MNNEAENENVLEWPWDMVPLESAVELIDDIKSRLPKDNELQGMDIAPLARHEEQRIWIWDNTSDEKVIVFNFSKRRKNGLFWYKIERNLETALKKYR